MSEAVNEDAKAETAEDDLVPKGCILYSTSTSMGGHGNWDSAQSLSSSFTQHVL